MRNFLGYHQQDWNSVQSVTASIFFKLSAIIRTFLQILVIYRNLLIFIEIYCNLFQFTEIYSNLMKFIEIYSNLMKFIAIYWNILKFIAIWTICAERAARLLWVRISILSLLLSSFTTSRHVCAISTNWDRWLWKVMEMMNWASY